MTDLNIHQRKLAVMKDASAITLDGHHNLGFDYITIQNLSNQLRKLCVEHGIDILPSISDGKVMIELTNADDPDDSITSFWPVVEGDKGWAYTIKYPLMRLFLIGDGDERDEAEMANKASKGDQVAQAILEAERAPQFSVVDPPAPNDVVQGSDIVYQEGDECPECIQFKKTDPTSSIGKFKIAKGGINRGRLQCTGGVGKGETRQWFNHLAPMPTGDIPF